MDFKNTYISKYFKGIDFRVFQSFSRKFLPLEILNHQNAKVFPREIMDMYDLFL